MVDFTEEVEDRVSGCLQLAILLEVSAHPKPGNVHRTADFSETRFEHFLASAVAAAPHFRSAVKKGIMTSSKEIGVEDVGVGAIIKAAVRDVFLWQHGGNTLLGSILLLSPIAVAAGMAFTEKAFSTTSLRKKLKTVVESTTPTDGVNVYDALSIAKPGGMGRVPRLDVTDSASKKELLEKQVTLFDVFKIASKYDSIASEWVNNYRITFEVGYPYLKSQLKKTNDVNIATVHTFLKILSRVPDTLIARKGGFEKAKITSLQAERVLRRGGLTDPEGREELRSLDLKLRDPTHELNPGTTADIVTAVLAIALLKGYRP